MDPDTPPVGRQPSAILVTPSKPGSPWYGCIRGGTREPLGVTGGDRFTHEQEQTLITMGLDVLTVPTIVAKRQAIYAELWWPDNSLPPVYAFECPVIGKTVDRVRIIAPNGSKQLVLPSGWVSHPFRDPLRLKIKLKGFL